MMKKSKLLLASFCLSLLPNCAGTKKAPPPTPSKQSAADQILRIGDTWVNIKPEKGILSPPSKISMFKNRRESEITLTHESARERLIIKENLELRDGGSVICRTELNHQLTMRWGRKQGQAALELVRPALNTPRTCDGEHPNGAILEDSKRVLFVLKSDNLVAIEPLLDQRSYTSGRL